MFVSSNNSKAPGLKKFWSHVSRAAPRCLQRTNWASAAPLLSIEHHTLVVNITYILFHTYTYEMCMFRFAHNNHLSDFLCCCSRIDRYKCLKNKTIVGGLHLQASYGKMTFSEEMRSQSGFVAISFLFLFCFRWRLQAFFNKVFRFA